MTAVLDRVPVDRIGEQARAVRLARVLLTLVVGVLFAFGWTAGKLLLVLAWCAVAVKVGWQEARSSARPAG